LTIKVDHISLSTTPIFLSKENNIVSQGTGFFYVHQNEALQILYLITNYHVLSGSSPIESKPPIGDSIYFQLHLSEVESGKVKTVKYPLYAKNRKPIWVKSLSYPDADLAVIPLLPSLYKDCKIYCISAEWAKGDIRLRPATSITLVGYPYGFYDKENALPIWKTGSIASEPDVNFNGKPLFLIDVSAFPGMSGSPVFAISYGTYETETGPTKVGGIQKFLGIYASMQMIGKKKYLEEITQEARIGIVDSESLEIGNVWKADLILETVKNINVKSYEAEILKYLV
jgi:hypothetical protein